MVFPARLSGQLKLRSRSLSELGEMLLSRRPGKTIKWFRLLDDPQPQAEGWGE
jgi:hypothetical protein